MITAGLTLQLSLVNLQGSNKHEFPFMRRKLVISASTERRLLSYKDGHSTMDGTRSKFYEFTHSEKTLISSFFFCLDSQKKQGWRNKNNKLRFPVFCAPEYELKKQNKILPNQLTSQFTKMSLSQIPISVLIIDMGSGRRHCLGPS